MSRYNTPLRYPGGKQKLTPFILEILEANNLVGGEYAEPYAGGAGVAIELLLSGKVARIHLNDASKAVYSFWRAIIDQTAEFTRRVAAAALTIEEWRRQKEILSRPEEFDDLDLGFSLFFLNRCNRSGIPSGGVIGGIEQKGEWKMDARFSRNELIRRIEAIALQGGNICLHNLDAETFIMDHLPALPENSLVYCDPPYFKKANRLYLNHYKPEDHERISIVIQAGLGTHWLVSYDSVPQIHAFYEERRWLHYDLNYHANRARTGTEAFYFSDDLTIPVYSSLPAINRALEGPGLFD